MSGRSARGKNRSATMARGTDSAAAAKGGDGAGAEAGLDLLPILRAPERWPVEREVILPPGSGEVRLLIQVRGDEVQVRAWRRVPVADDGAGQEAGATPTLLTMSRTRGRAGGSRSPRGSPSR